MKLYTMLFFLITSLSFAQIAENAEDVCPIMIGESLPEVTLIDQNGKGVNLTTVNERYCF